MHSLVLTRSCLAVWVLTCCVMLNLRANTRVHTGHAKPADDDACFDCLELMVLVPVLVAGAVKEALADASWKRGWSEG